MDTIALRPIEKWDVNLCYAWANDAELVRYLPSMPRPLTWEKHLLWAKDALSASSQRHFMIDLVPPGFDLVSGLNMTRAIGRVHASGLTTRTPEVGIFIGDRQAWGHGYATEAVGRMCEWLQASGPWKSCQALIHPENTASMGVFGRNGFFRTEEMGRGEQFIYRKELR